MEPRACSTTCSCRSSSSAAAATRIRTTSRSTEGGTLIETRRFASVDAFLEVAGAFLEAREPAHHLSLGILGNLRAAGMPPDGALVAAVRGEAVVATAVWSASWDVVLSEIDDPAAAEALAGALATEDLRGVHGPIERVEAFARAWAGERGVTCRQAMHQRIYALERVRPPVGVPGRLRRAILADRATLVDWTTAFDREAMGSPVARDHEVLADELIASERRLGYVWEDGAPVSMLQATGATPHGIRIGAVYTPPERRGRGYASACVAAASQAQLDAGRRWCFLFTDVTNPTSNRIYQAIGYEPVRDVAVWRFAPGAA